MGLAGDIAVQAIAGCCYKAKIAIEIVPNRRNATGQNVCVAALNFQKWHTRDQTISNS